MQTTVEVLTALTPFGVLLAGFLVFKFDALVTSLCGWLSELALVLSYYHMSFPKALEASLWGSVTMWSGFLVVYTGQIFGQAFRGTGLLQLLLDSVESIVPANDTKARALALTGVVGGFIGAFNGFATYPVTIPGLVELGFDGVRAVTAYLVYFAWQEALVSLFIAANISSIATHLPVEAIVRLIGLFSIPLVLISLLGFLKVLGFRFFTRESQTLFWILGLSNIASILLFTQLWPAYYVVTLIMGSAFSLVALIVYGRLLRSRLASAPPVPAAARPRRATVSVRAYAPLVLGAGIVVVATVPEVATALRHFEFIAVAWGYAPVRISFFTSAGFFVLLTALCCYAFRVKPSSITEDFAIATRRSGMSLATLFIGSGMVHLMTDSGQISFLAGIAARGGREAYVALTPVLAFLGGIAFGQGLPADFLFAQMQVPVAAELGIPLVLLVGITTVATMGPPNGLKPVLIKYTASLANVSGKDGEIFRITLPWQLLQVATASAVAILLLFFFT